MKTSDFNNFSHVSDETARTALAAIEARLDGVLDHPALVGAGEPTSDLLGDVRRLLNLARHHQLAELPKLIHVFPESAPADRIMCSFTEQVEFRGHVHDGDERQIDVTSVVLALDLDSINELRDYTPDVDDIALQVVSHNGPFRALMTEAIAEFFDVEDVDHITQEMLDEKRVAYGVEPNEPEGMKP